MQINEAYRILGIDQNASEDKVKSAYRQKAREIQDYGGESMPQKMEQLNDAYDTVINNMRMGHNGQGGSYSSLKDIRDKINSGRTAEAEQLLDSMPRPNRTAEWYYLKGLVLKNKGWLEDAKTHFAAAARMDPTNKEYQNAANGYYQNNQQNQNHYNGSYSNGRYNQSYNGSYGNGGYNNGGYHTGPAYNNSGCSGCDVCTSLLCADCCCECMGGDLIRCC